MKTWKFDSILTSDGWISPGFITVENGKIRSITNTGTGKADEIVRGYAVPGFQNAHSHAFQYGMAGIAEQGASKDRESTFWTWRERMYQLALKISPEDLEAIATMLYIEMARHGYTAVAEFQYVHHDPAGKPYDNLAEMSERVLRAANTAGINITLLPVFYQKGGFGQEPQEDQQRFISKDYASYVELRDACQKLLPHYPQARLGHCIHSIRAVSEEDILAFANDYRSGPVHIHISEQKKEVEQAIAYYGARPVEWLQDKLSFDENLQLVHATHLNERELMSIISNNVNVVLCPSTEANLGDGLFRFRDFVRRGGSWSIGTDSHISLSPLEELRLLDYGQRLISNQRDTFHHAAKGEQAILSSWLAGSRAMGKNPRSAFEPGLSFDAAVLNPDLPLTGVSKTEHILPTVIYTGDRSAIAGTIVNGEWVTRNGEHVHRKKALDAFKEVFRRLGTR